MKRSREDLIQILVLADEGNLAPDDLIDPDDIPWMVVLNLDAGEVPHSPGALCITLNMGDLNSTPVSEYKPREPPLYSRDAEPAEEEPAQSFKPDNREEGKYFIY